MSAAPGAMVAPHRFIVEVPGLHTVAEDNAHESFWKKAARGKLQTSAVLQVLDARALRCPFPLPIDVTITRLSAGRLDEFDNLPGALKHVADAVAWWARGRVGKIGQADRDPHAIRFAARQERCPRGQRGVRIEVAPRVQPEPSTGLQEGRKACRDVG